MINLVELARQQHNVSLTDDIKSVKKELSATVEEHLFTMLKGKSIGYVSEILEMLRVRLC